jgi:periplasmic protein TonB
MALLARAPEVDELAPPAIAVSLLTEQQPSEPPAVRPRLPDIVMPQVVVPLVSIDIPMDVPPPPPPIAVMASVEPAPIPPTTALPVPVSNRDSSEPVMATSVEYLRPPVLTYPAAAKQARATGTVLVRAVVEADGRVREVRVDRSSGYALLDRAAMEAMRKALFRPYMHDGVARAAVVVVPMEFELKTRGATS